MSELFKYLQKLSPSTSIIALLIALVVLIVSKWDSISKFIKWILGKSSKLRKRTCGDCVLILFGIREKYEHEIRHLDTSLLRQQMKFGEQKIQEAIFFLSQSFADDIKILGDGAEYEKKAVQSALYCEALKNGMLSVKDELRRSFKENGFGAFSEIEFSHYVKDKTKIMLTIVRSYLNQHYIDGDGTIVHLKERFERMDESGLRKFEGWSFEVFTSAKDLIEEHRVKKERLTEEFRSEIDKFVENGQNTTDC